jgi:hypothetical protein
MEPKEGQGQCPQKMTLLEVGFLPAVMKIRLIQFLNENRDVTFAT